MNITEIYQKLREALIKLENGNIDDDTKLDLEILVIQLKKQLLLGGFDPLREISGVTIADISTLDELIGQVDKVIQEESKRTNLVKKIVATA